MENYCPYCKAPITEADQVKVCPACGIAHHQSCWEQNHGCTTFGCSMQNSVVAPAAPVPPVAPAPAPAPAKRFCAGCGAELAPDQAFCPNCGTPAPAAPAAAPAYGAAAPADPYAPVSYPPVAEPKKIKKPLIIGGIIVAVLALVLLLFPNMFASVESLCEKGKYEEAYEKAKGSEKDRVLAENVIAYLSSESVDMLKDPTSFALRDAYYYLFNRDDGTFGQQAVLYVSGKNSYGNTVSSYWVWVYDNNEEKWEYWGSATTTSKESGDDYTDTLIKIVLESVMEEGLHLQKSQIKNINNMFEDDTLFDVTLIDKEDIDTSRFPNG